MPRKQIILLMILFTFLASGTHIFGKMATDAFPTFLLGASRLWIGSGVLALLVWSQRQPLFIDKSDLPVFIALSILGVSANIVLFLWGLRGTIPAHGGLLYATTPIWVLLIGRLMGREAITARKVQGIALSVCGVTLVLGENLLNVNSGFLFGDFLILLAVLSWAAYTAFSKQYIMKYHPLTATFSVTIISALLLTVPALLSLPDVSVATIPPSAWFGLVYMGVFTSAISYLIYYSVLRQVDPSQLAIIITAQAPATAAMSWAFQGYAVGLLFILGGSLTLYGIWRVLGTPRNP